MSLTSSLSEEVAATDSESDCVAVELLWNALIKAAHSKSAKSEFNRLQSLVADLDFKQATELVHHAGVDTLLDLHPLLETVLVDGHERLQAQQVAHECATIRDVRDATPNEAEAAF